MTRRLLALTGVLLVLGAVALFTGTGHQHPMAADGMLVAGGAVLSAAWWRRFPTSG